MSAIIPRCNVEVYKPGADDCRAKLWDKVDLVKIKQQFGAKAFQKDGPHDWMVDLLTILPGKTIPRGWVYV